MDVAGAAGDFERDLAVVPLGHADVLGLADAALFMRPLREQLRLDDPVCIFASSACTSWKPPMGLPNITRFLLYEVEDSKHAIAAPTTPNAMPKRACVGQPSGALAVAVRRRLPSGTNVLQHEFAGDRPAQQCLRFCSGAE